MKKTKKKTISTSQASLREAEKTAKIARIKRKLQEIREYKKLLAQDGIQPDEEDKQRESELIVQLLRLEKGLSPKAPKKKRRVNKNS